MPDPGDTGLHDVRAALNDTVQAINALTKSLAGAILTGPQGTTGVSGSTGPSGTLTLRSYLAGLALSNDGGSPNTVLDIAAGVATDTTVATTMTLGAFTKSVSAAWVSGTGNGGMGQGLTIAATTWYHVILANNGGTPDVYFDTSVTGANRPAGISDVKIRRIGSFLTDGSSHIVAFSQNGDEFLWAVSVNDVSVVNLGATAVLYPLTVPTGLKIVARIRAVTTNTLINTQVVITSPDETDQAPSGAVGLITSANPLSSSVPGTVATVDVRTNTSAQLRARSTAGSTTLNVSTYGWIDRRGRDA